jgi:3-oxoacyl-[acyl-carrier-protein] synthase II
LDWETIPGHLLVPAHSSIVITGLGALSALGADVSSHHRALLGGQPLFRPLAELLGAASPHAQRPAAWIAERELLLNRKWSPATMAALRVAREAVAEARWTADDLRDAALVLGTSRGNAAGWLGPWPGRRPFRLMAASNTIHSEPASAITIELGIGGPNHVLASGCAAGLDAIGIAMMLIQSGQAERALAVAVDLPLVPLLLDNYAASGLLATGHGLNPYHPQASGFIPAEGAAALAIESRSGSFPKLLHYGCNADACDPVGIPASGGRTPDLLNKAMELHGAPAAVCPHATGTAVQALAESAVFSRALVEPLPTLHLLKPWVGHAIGASGLLESVILARFLRDGKLPPNVPGLMAPAGFQLPNQLLAAEGPVYKLSHGMGGHNALLLLSPP